METLEIALDENGSKVVVLPDIIFSNKQNIDWDEVEKYLERYVGELVEIAETGDVVYLGKDIPVMPQTAGIIIRPGLLCRYMTMI